MGVGVRIKYTFPTPPACLANRAKYRSDSARGKLKAFTATGAGFAGGGVCAVASPAKLIATVVAAHKRKRGFVIADSP
jgi:hypothetical protein